MEKEALKNTARLYLYHQTLIPSPKIFNINQKSDFKQQNRTLLKRNRKGIILSGEWMSIFTYNGKFDGNILIVGRTGCGKTTSVQNLGKNELFGDIK